MAGLVPSFLSSCTYVIGHVTIPRITVVYSSIVKLLFTIHQSTVHTRNKKMESPVSIPSLPLCLFVPETEKGHPSESKQHQRDASRNNEKNQGNGGVTPVSEMNT